MSSRDTVSLVAKASAAAIAVAAFAFGLWQVRSIVVLLLLALTFAAAIRPGVEWLRRRRVPQPAAIGAFFIGISALIVVFFWAAVPPAIHEVQQALHQHDGKSHGVRHDVLTWVDSFLHRTPSGSAVLHPVATYGHQATSAIVATFFTLAATWYWVSERDKMIDLLTAFAPEAKREKARRTFLAIDARLGSYTRLKFLMIFVVGAALSAGFYVVGLHYWLLAGGFVSLVEIVPVIGPLVGSIFVVAIGLPAPVAARRGARAARARRRARVPELRRQPPPDGTFRRARGAVHIGCGDAHRRVRSRQGTARAAAAQVGVFSAAGPSPS